MNAVDELLGRIVKHVSEIPEVVAIALGGSRATGHATIDSDFDIYVYVSSQLSPERRLAIGGEFSADSQIVDFWGPALEFRTDEALFDLVFFETRWMADQVARTMTHCEAALGYSTCFVYTVAHSQVLYESNNWLSALQEMARKPYPSALARRIAELNMAAMSGCYSSYREQIAKAVRRKDYVGLNHRVSAFIACMFDIVFALNRRLHPGEKRLLETVEATCSIKPSDFSHQVTSLALCLDWESGILLETVDSLIAELRSLCIENGMKAAVA